MCCGSKSLEKTLCSVIVTHYGLSKLRKMRNGGKKKLQYPPLTAVKTKTKLHSKNFPYLRECILDGKEIITAVVQVLFKRQDLNWSGRCSDSFGTASIHKRNNKWNLGCTVWRWEARPSLCGHVLGGDSENRSKESSKARRRED